MNMDFQKISPLWETFPVRQTGTTESVKTAESSVFKDIFQSLVDNVRESEDEKEKKEYRLSTGQLDNPADLTLATANASNSALLLMTLRDRAMDVYNELMRISL